MGSYQVSKALRVWTVFSSKQSALGGRGGTEAQVLSDPAFPGHMGHISLYLCPSSSYPPSFGLVQGCCVSGMKPLMHVPLPVPLPLLLSLITVLLVQKLSPQAEATPALLILRT